MRVVKEFTKEGIRVSIFNWNNKFLIKFELGPLEQTFKVSELDVLVEDDLEQFYKGEFFDKVMLRFKEMGQSLQNQLQNL
ncbi:hypothetical protein [Cecembia calidifontis]|jgi:hypothetical protein|uniref:Uncharacterized protein n=1 Tax=Cecembia calidifontis TaxID=1187080 RepID=A0A4Q7PAC7_9BACT|nr:hypothetical protein [Cecembia calidifontis]RZS96897.1 hypothetical protein BC751_2492 [Cecembia calidifontis]